MNEELSSGFRIKDWEIWPLRNLLNGPDGEHHIEPKAMQVLVALASQPGEVVSRESLLDEIWPDTYSGEVSLTRCVSQLRHQFSDERGNSEFIETIPKTGYRLVAPVKAFADEKSQDRPRSNTWVAVAIAVLFLGFGYLAFDRLVLEPARHTVTVKAVIPADNSIAVLPFINVSDDPGNEYFSDGVSEEILNLLTQVSELRVTSRPSIEAVIGQNLDVPTMAGKLNVAHFLEGSVRKSGNELRITAQLIAVETDTYLWSETYDRDLKDVFAIQDEIAAAVVDALKIELLGGQLKAAETDPEAYAMYLQARHLMNQFNAESFQRAETLLEQVLAIDPGFAPAWTATGNVYQRNFFDLRTRDESVELARDAIQKALAIDPQYGPAYAALAAVAMLYDFDFTAASQYLQLAQKLNPGDAAILRTAADLELINGRVNEAIDLLQRSVALDPVWNRAHFYLGFAYYYAHRLEEATDALQMARSLSPAGIVHQYLLGRVLLAQEDAAVALMAMEQEPNKVFRLHGLALVHHLLGDTGASDAALQELIDCCAAEAATQVASAYAFRGDVNHAFDWLEQSYDNRDGGLMYLLLNPLYANLHDDPRWKPLLDKMGLPH